VTRAPAGPSRPTGVLVVSTAYRAGPWACRSLRAAGYRVIGTHETGVGAGGRSRDCPRPRRHPSPRTDPDGFLAAIAATCVREGIDVVLPVSEDATRVIAYRADDLGEVVVAGPSARQFEELCDKGRLAAACDRAGVDHPATVAVESAVDHRVRWPALPSIVKPRTSGEALQGADAARRVSTPAERERAVDLMLATGLGAVVQEAVEGRLWVAHCVRGLGGFGMVAARVDTTAPRGIGTSSLSRTVATPPALFDAARRLLDLVDYRGPCCLNLIERDGRFWLHDVNLRLAASVGAAVGSGFDQPRLGVEAALGMPWTEGLPAGRPTRYVRWDGEIAGLVSELRARRPRDAARTIGALVGGVLTPGAVVDPSPLDPAYLWDSAQRRTLRLARRAVEGLAARS
jgi:hypothetical protein